MCLDCHNWLDLSLNQKHKRGRRDDDESRSDSCGMDTNHPPSPPSFATSHTSTASDSPSSSKRRTKQMTFPSPHKNSTDQPTRNKSSRAREREDPYTQPTRHRSQTTHLDGRGQGGAQTARRARNHGCRGLLLRVSVGGGCMGGAENRSVEETNKKLVGSLRVPWCANWERDHGLRSLCAAFRVLGSWPGRSCRGWAVLCVW